MLDGPRGGGNPPKTLPKPSKNPRENCPGGFFEGFWRVLGPFGAEIWTNLVKFRQIWPNFGPKGSRNPPKTPGEKKKPPRGFFRGILEGFGRVFTRFFEGFPRGGPFNMFRVLGPFSGFPNFPAFSGPCDRNSNPDVFHGTQSRGCLRTSRATSRMHSGLTCWRIHSAAWQCLRPKEMIKARRREERLHGA